jgi:hypothetical protein
MYANVAGEEFTDASAFAARAIQEMKKKRHPGTKEVIKKISMPLKTS